MANFQRAARASISPTVPGGWGLRGPTTSVTRQRDLPGRWEPQGVHQAPQTFFHDIYLLKKTPDTSLQLSHQEMVDLAYKGLGFPEGSLTGFLQADKRKVTICTTVDMVPGKDCGRIHICRTTSQPQLSWSESPGSRGYTSTTLRSSGQRKTSSSS